MLCCVILIIIYTRCRTSYHSIRQSPDRSAWSLPKRTGKLHGRLARFRPRRCSVFSEGSDAQWQEEPRASLPLQCHYPGRCESLVRPVAYIQVCVRSATACFQRLSGINNREKSQAIAEQTEYMAKQVEKVPRRVLEGKYGKSKAEKRSY